MPVRWHGLEAQAAAQFIIQLTGHKRRAMKMYTVIDLSPSVNMAAAANCSSNVASSNAALLNEVLKQYEVAAPQRLTVAPP